MINRIATTLIISGLYIAACGYEEPAYESTEEGYDFEPDATAEPYSVTEDYIKIPRCTQGKEETMIYLRYEEILMVCRDSQWHFFADPTDDDSSCPVTEPYETIEDEEEIEDDTDDRKEKV